MTQKDEERQQEAGRETGQEERQEERYKDRQADRWLVTDAEGQRQFSYRPHGGVSP